MLARVRVLVTGGDHVGPLAAVRALRTAGHEPWALVPDRRAYAARSRATQGFVIAPDPGVDPAAFIDGVRTACDRVRPDVILPGTEPALVLLADRASDLAPVTVGAPAAALVARATDKSCLPELARKAGLELLPTRVVARDQALAVAAALGYPVIVKPVRSDTRNGDALAHGIPQRAADEVGLRAALAELPGDAVLVQPYLQGRLAAVCGVAWEGVLVCAVHQIARRIWPPDVGISAFAETVPRDDELEAGVGRLLADLEWSGIFQLQFLRAEAHAYLIDINPRIYGSLALAVAAGLNLPAIWVDLLAGRAPAAASYRVGTRYRSEERELQAVLHALAHGPRREGLRALVPRRRTTHAILRAGDPRPALGSLAKLR